MKLRMCLLVAACTLSMASFATGTVPCKSGQKTAQKGGQACAPATKSKTTAKAVNQGAAKPANKATIRSKASTKATGRTKPGSRSRSRLKTTAEATAAQIAQTTSELPPMPTDADCGSTQTLLQGGAAQCPVPPSSSGAGSAASAQTNPGSSCFAALAASNASRQLASRVPFLSDSAPSAEALANRALPNKREKEELHSVLAGYDMCLDMAAGWRKQAYAPALVQALDAYWLEAKSILGELAAGKRNFGDAAKAIADSDKAFRSQAGMPTNNAPPTSTDHTPAPVR